MRFCLTFGAVFSLSHFCRKSTMNQTSRQEGGHICEPEWFHNKVKISDDNETEDTLEVLKAKADHDYAKHNFVQAGDLYGQILNRPQINMPLFREACEGRVRCLIKDLTQNQDEAQNLAMQNGLSSS